MILGFDLRAYGINRIITILPNRSTWTVLNLQINQAISNIRYVQVYVFYNNKVWIVKIILLNYGHIRTYYGHKKF